MAEYSPLVHRAVRSGALLLAVASAQFVAVMIVVQQRYAHYSLTANYISDLGGASSPWALLFDVSVILLGALAILALLLVWSAFDERPIRLWGLLLLLVAGAGAIGVGVFPETSHLLGGHAHFVASGVAFVGAVLGLVVLSFGMEDPHRWRFSRPYTLVSGLVSGAATVLLLLGYYLGLGAGGMERLVVAPVLLWMIVEGTHIALLHRFAPGLAVPTPAA
jgi:hypothetical membrane protein